MTVNVVTKKRLYRVDERAVEQAKQIGLCGNIVKRLQRMGMRAALFTHPDGNRRFDDFVLMVEDKTIVGINRI